MLTIISNRYFSLLLHLKDLFALKLSLLVIVVVVVVLAGRQLLPVALLAEDVALERVTLLALNAGVEDQAAVLRKYDILCTSIQYKKRLGMKYIQDA